MGAIAVAKRAENAHGPTLDLYRGFVPRAILLHWIAKETGWDRLAVSIDKRLIESGWSQAPLARAWSQAGGVDPFDTYGACYLAGLEAIEDAAYWMNAKGSDDPDRIRVAEWLPRHDRNLWYICELDYSVGSGALRHISYCATLWAQGKGRKPSDRGLMAEIIDWCETADLSQPKHRQYFGRQSPEKILARVRKHADWVRDSAEVGPIDDAPEGQYPPERRPDECAPFPRELVADATVVNQRDATADQCERSWKSVRSYVKARRRREFMPAEKAVARAKRWVKGIVTPQPTYADYIWVERDGVPPRSVVPW